MKRVLLTSIALTLLALSCAEEEEITPYPEATSPVNVLKRVEISFNQGDAGLFDDMLSKAFVFHFDPDDVGQSPPGGSQYDIPETWSETEFRSVIRKMFKSAYSISLTIPTSSVGEPDPNEPIYKAENINIKLLVMIDEVNGFIADAGYCDFQFERYEGEEGQESWRLTKWWDRTATCFDGNLSLRPTSLGRVLAIYY